MTDEPEVALEGTIDRITFRNADNDYTIARLVSGTTESTIVGKLFGVEEGMPVRVTGRWVVDRKWGRQFQVATCVPTTPKTVVGIEKLLGSKAFPGIGPALAKRLVEKFGRETLDIITHHPERLTEVIGIGAQRAAKLAEIVTDQRQVQEVMVFLYGLGVSPAFASRIVRRYGKEAINVVRANPYRLAREVWGIGFRTADAIAGQLGLARDAPARLEAGLLFALETASEDGHVCLPDDDLLARAAELLQIEPAVLPERLAALATSGLVIRESVDARGAVSALPELHAAEVAAATRLAELAHSIPRSLALDIRAALHAFEHLTGVTLADQQRRAVEAALRDPCVVITGGPGVGKTTIVKAIVHLARISHHKVALAAPTGRAAKRLGEATATTAMTIHRLLEYQPQRSAFARDSGNPLDADLVVVDESSMVDTAARCGTARGGAGRARGSCWSAMSISCRRWAPAQCCAT